MCQDCPNLRETYGVKRYYCRLNPTVFFTDEVLDVCYCKSEKHYTTKELRESKTEFKNDFCYKTCRYKFKCVDINFCPLDYFINWLEDKE